jgi:hypothetical protein
LRKHKGEAASITNWRFHGFALNDWKPYREKLRLHVAAGQEKKYSICAGNTLPEFVESPSFSAI